MIVQTGEDMHVDLKWNEKMSFTATADSGHPVEMDAAPAAGGEDKAVRPKELVLQGLAGCTAMDVISILKKMQLTPESMRIEVDAPLSEEHPKVFTKIHLKYFVKGNIPEDRLKRAIELSQDLYCGVSAMLRKGCEVTYEYHHE
jgi:putative redox protein